MYSLYVDTQNEINVAALILSAMDLMFTGLGIWLAIYYSRRDRQNAIDVEQRD